MCSVALSYSKQATTSFTQFAYTTLTDHTYSLVANNLTQFIMEQRISDCIITISDNEIDFIDSWWEHHPEKFANNFPDLGTEEFGIDSEMLPF